MADVGFRFIQINNNNDNDNNSVESDDKNEDEMWMERNGDSSIYDEGCSAVWHNRKLFKTVESSDVIDLKQTERFDYINNYHEEEHIIVIRTYERRGEGIYLINAQWKYYEDNGVDGMEINSVNDADDESALRDFIFDLDELSESDNESDSDSD